MSPRASLMLALTAGCPLLAAGCERADDSNDRHAALSARRAPSARFVKQIEWIGTGLWLKADTHIHTVFSDGNHQVDEVVRQARAFGCDVVAITDHADRDAGAATDEYFAAIRTARRSHPNMIILAGLEWNVPPTDGGEHLTVLVSDEPRFERLLTEFKQRFDDLGREVHDAALADRGLRWLAAQVEARGVLPVMFYNHPSRKDARSLENVADILHWRTVNDLLIGFSGAPGHQTHIPIGAYKYLEQTIDRWDPAAARVGDAWDTLLGQGLDIWAARAPSDFHNADLAHTTDPWPGQFSETWLYCPERSAAGVLRAFRAGAFFGVHGRIARQVEFSVEIIGLPRRAWPGEVVETPADTLVTVRVEFVVPPRDYSGAPNRIDAVELIGVSAQGARIIAQCAPRSADGGRATVAETVRVPAGGLVLRARGRRRLDDAPDLMFYTNPIRIVTDSNR